MTVGPRLLIVALLILIAVVIGYRYEQYIIAGNYDIQVNTACDPQSENCFAPSDPTSIFPFQEKSYKKIDILARYAPPCLEEHTCSNFSCAGIPKCTVTFCSQDALSDGEICTSSAP